LVTQPLLMLNLGPPNLRALKLEISSLGLRLLGTFPSQPFHPSKKKARAVVATIARRTNRQRSALREAHTAVALMETVVPRVLSQTLATPIHIICCNNNNGYQMCIGEIDFNMPVTINININGGGKGKKGGK